MSTSTSTTRFILSKHHGIVYHDHVYDRPPHRNTKSLSLDPLDFLNPKPQCEHENVNRRPAPLPLRLTGSDTIVGNLPFLSFRLFNTAPLHGARQLFNGSLQPHRRWIL